MKNIIKTNEIIKIVQDDIAVHMADGWVINPAFNCGSQGEIFKMALVKGCRTRMFSIIEPRNSLDHDLVYRVEDFNFGFNFFDSLQTAWLGKGEEFKTVAFYSISRGRRGDAYTMNDEFITEINEKQRARAHNRNCNYDRYLNVSKSEIKKFLKKVPGYKRVKEEDIESLAVCFGWNGKKYYRISFYNKKALVYNL